MYYGRMTAELEKLYDEYYAVFEEYPDCWIELEYGQADYADYVLDIKRAIKEKKQLIYVADYEENDW